MVAYKNDAGGSDRGGSKMKRKFVVFRGPIQTPEQKQPNMSTNPLSVPGGWNKDTPATEKPNPSECRLANSHVQAEAHRYTAENEGQLVPRSAAGIVNDVGDIVDQSGKSVGKIADSQDPQQLVGNTVTTTGEVISSAGDVLGKAILGDSGSGDEYTTAGKDESKSSGGLLGRTTKGLFNTVSGVGKPVTDGLGSLTRRGQKAEEQVDDTTNENPTDKAESTAGADTEATDAANNAVDETKADAQDAQDAPVELQDREEADDSAMLETDDTLKQDTENPEKDPAEAEAQEGEQAEAPEDGEQPVDYSALEGATVNKAGNLVDKTGCVVGRLADGDAKKLQGKKCDGNGDIWNDAGKIVGKGEPIPQTERDTAKDFAPFENFPDAVVEADGRVTCDGQQVGTVVEGDPKRLKGSKVDEDGDILDRNGNTVGKAEPWDEPEAEQEEVPDRSILAGKRVNKAGNVVDQSGAIFGRVVEGNVSAIVGRMCDKDGNIRSESGDVVGKAEVIPEGEREGSKEGPFAELEGCTVSKDGKVVTASGDVVGRLTSGDPKSLFGRSVDADGDVVDGNGNVLAKAERWEEPEVEKKKGPMAGYKVNREGNVVGEDGHILGKLVSGDLMICAGKEVDDDGDVINSKGNTVGHVALLEDIPGESAEDKEKREQDEKDRKLAQQLSMAIEQSLEKLRPILKMIADKVDKAESTPKEELDEEQLVKEVKPLIEEGGKILTETNGMIRGMDPDGRIQRNAKHKSATKDASPEEHHLAEVLKEVRRPNPHAQSETMC